MNYTIFSQMKSVLFIGLRRVILACSSLYLQFYIPYHIKKFFLNPVIKKVNGFDMQLDLKKDKGISKDLFIFGKREHISTDFILKSGVIKDDDTVLDIGANIGYYALIESKLVGQNGKVYAIEPVSANYETLLENLRLNNIKNISTFKLAAGSQNGESDIYVSKKGNISSFVYKDNFDFVGTEKVKVIRVDDFASENGFKPDFVRMDVEGFEKEIIKGMKNTLSNKPKLLIEVHPHLMKADELKEMFLTIKNSGYSKAVVIKERNHIWMDKKGEVKKIFTFLNRQINKEKPVLGTGSIEKMSISDLIVSLNGRGSAFHVLLS